MIALLAISLVFFTRLTSSGFLANRVLFLIMLALIVVNAVNVIVQFPLRENKLGKLICGAVAVILSVVMLWTMVGVSSAESALSRITGKLVETEVIAVVVRADDPAQKLSDTVGYTYGYLDNLDQENTSSMLQHLQEQLGELTPNPCASITELADDLYSSRVGAVFMNTGFLRLLEYSEDYADFFEKTRIIYEYRISREVISPTETGNISEPFIIYCNGIDSRSNDITASGNSDVNILAVVNPQSREILLLNTPRDYYVPLHMNGKYDKLTHAGNYGIDESIGTLSDLYNVKVPYYVRLNFFGLVDVVDAIGGVDVESPKEFTTVSMEIPNESGKLENRSFTFPAGPVHLNGREALAFSRERKAFASGDNQRGQNQMTVIKGIIDKATSPAVLSRYQSLIKAVTDAFVTNVSYDDVASLVKNQQKDTRPWHVSTYAVTGPGGSDYCYSWPNQQLYVTRQDPDSVAFAKTLIQQVLNGERPDLPDQDEDGANTR